jgi:cytidylate kinase
MGTYIKKLEEFEKGLKLKKEGITITVSGTSGSGKSNISRAIAKEFKLKHVSVGDIFRKLASERKMNVVKFAGVREKEVDYRADEETLKLVKKGRIVLNGRLTGWVAGDNADVRIFITCDINEKAKRVSKRDVESITEAKKDLEKRDTDDNCVYKELYGIDMNDLSIYNEIIDTTKISTEESSKIAIELIKKHLKM